MLTLEDDPLLEASRAAVAAMALFLWLIPRQSCQWFLVGLQVLGSGVPTAANCKLVHYLRYKQASLQAYAHCFSGAGLHACSLILAHPPMLQALSFLLCCSSHEDAWASKLTDTWRQMKTLTRLPVADSRHVP